MEFRIAIGSGKCRNRKTTGVLHELCKLVLARLDTLQHWQPSQLRLLPKTEIDDVNSSGHNIQITTYCENLENGQTLIVVEAFVHSFRWPTYFSLHDVGHLVAEGIVIGEDGSVSEAPDDLLWSYR